MTYKLIFINLSIRLKTDIYKLIELSQKIINR